MDRPNGNNEPIHLGLGKVRQRYEENYLGKGPAILSEFKENGERTIGSYQYRTSIHADEFDASAGSFNISSQHTISSGNENMFVKNNTSNNIFFPVWQHYNSNTATQRVYGADTFEETGTRTVTGIPIPFTTVQPALINNASVWKASCDFSQDYPNGIKIEVWNGNTPNGKAQWIHREERPIIAGLTEIIYNRPNEQKAGNEAYIKVSDLRTGEDCLGFPTQEDVNIPYFNDTYKTFEDIEIAIKPDIYKALLGEDLGQLMMGEVERFGELPSMRNHERYSSVKIKMVLSFEKLRDTIKHNKTIQH